MRFPQIGAAQHSQKRLLRGELALIVGGDLVAFSLVANGRAEVALVVAFATFVVAGWMMYRSLRHSYDRMQVLDEFSASLGASVIDGDAAPALLRRAHEILGADCAWLVLSEGGELATLEFDGEKLESGRAQHIDHEMVTRLQGTLQETVSFNVKVEHWGARRVRHVLGASLPVTNGGLAILAVSRGQRRAAFRHHEVEMFSRIAMHGGVAIQNVRLMEWLRAESDTNRHQADHDALTGLPNRSRFRRALGEAIDAGLQTAVMIIDLDRFKDVNDTLGHQVGDRLLAEAAARMRSGLDPSVLLARLGGDEFAMLVTGPGFNEDDLLELARLMREDMQLPFHLAGVQIDVGASIGVALGRLRGEEVGDLMRRADIAMYAAKTDRTGVEVYKVALDQHTTERLQLVPRLRNAIEQRELQLYFQPQLDLKSGQVVGAETLIRWPLEGVGFVSPDDFLPVAERTDLIRPLTRLVLEEAVAQCARWREAGHHMRVSVNLSARNLLEHDLADHISDLVHAAGLPVGALRVELTETALLTRAEEAAEALRRLRETGVGVALDDFGTGHSSLSYLTTLPVDEVKIDKSFVLDLGIDPVAERVVRAIVELGVSLNLEVVAEGVETSRHCDLLSQMGCGLGQGFFFARPMPPGQFEAWLEEHRRWTRPNSGGRDPARPSLVETLLS